MSRFRKIDPRIWNDEKFRELSDQAKLVFLFILTHPHLTPLGCMRATLEGLAAELGWETKAFREAFGEALSKALLKHDEKACFISATNFLRYNKPESPNVVKAWLRCIDDIPECECKEQLLQQVKDFLKALPETFRKALPQGLPEAFAKPLPNQEQEQETNKEQKKNYKKKKKQEPKKQQKPKPEHEPKTKQKKLNSTRSKLAGGVSSEHGQPPALHTSGKIAFCFDSGQFENVTESDVQRWTEAYPAVDVPLSIKQAAAWLVANPSKRKKNYKRFLTNWFARTQEKGGNGKTRKQKISEQDWGPYGLIDPAA